MKTELSNMTETQAAPLTSRGGLVRLAGIGVVVLGNASALLYLGGWFSPRALTPAKFVDPGSAERTQA